MAAMSRLHVVLLDNQLNDSRSDMWTLEFHVTFHNGEHCSPVIHRHKVDADMMFSVIKCGSFDWGKFRTYFLQEGDEGRSPRRGIRIFENVDLWEDAFED